MRAVKRHTLELNCQKQESLRKLCVAYTQEKKYWLNKLKGWEFQALLAKSRVIRDEHIRMKYTSKYGLQARHWKLALQEAAEIWDKYWQAIFVQMRPKIYKKFTCENKRHYAFWILNDYEQFAQCMMGKKPKPHFDINSKEVNQVLLFLQKSIKKLRGTSPRIKKARMVTFDANCYDTFEHGNRQYIKVMSLERGKRIVIPLMGRARLQGNVTLVMKEKMEIHLSQDVTPQAQIKTDLEAVDFGYTEVMTDTQGNRYGENLGNILTKASDERHKKMQRRHKLYALEKKICKINPKKAKNLRKYNLGRKKLESKTERVKQTIAKEVNTAINRFTINIGPKIVVTENLRHGFTFTSSKSLNRKFSCWVKGAIQDRMEFKALAKGFRHEQVNPAYGSQVCPYCGFVDSKNRNKDKFKCLHCGHEDMADRIAALNYSRRYGDKEIGLHMPCDQVKTILLERFQRRLEAEKSVTVPGRTLETESCVCPQASVEMCHNITVGRGNSLKPVGQSESETK